MAEGLLEQILEALDRIAQSLKSIDQELRLWLESGMASNGRWVSNAGISLETSVTVPKPSCLRTCLLLKIRFVLG